VLEDGKFIVATDDLVPLSEFKNDLVYWSQGVLTSLLTLNSRTNIIQRRVSTWNNLSRPCGELVDIYYSSALYNISLD